MLQYELKGFKQVYKLNQGHDKEIDRERVVPQWKQLDARKMIPGGPSISLFSLCIVHFSSCQSFSFFFFSPTPHLAVILSTLLNFPVLFFLLLISLLFPYVHLFPFLCLPHFGRSLFFMFSLSLTISLTLFLCLNPHSMERQERGKMMCDSCYISIFCQWD